MNTNTPKTVYELIRLHEEKNSKSHYFSSDTLKSFGERKSEMRLLKGVFEKVEFDGTIHQCYALSSRQRNAPKGVPQRRTHYFDVETLRRVIV